MKRHFILMMILCVVLVGALDVLASTPGTIKWACPIMGQIWKSYPAIGTDGTIYVGSMGYSSALCAVPLDGSVVLTLDLGSRQLWTPAIGQDGTIYGSSRYALCAFNPDYLLKWRFSTGTNYCSAPAIGADGTIYVASWLSFLAINSDGSWKWTFEPISIYFSSPAIGLDGTIYVGAEDNNLYAINPNGTQKWIFPIGGGGTPGSPAIGCDGTIYVGSSGGNLYALSPNGTKKWIFSTGVDFGDPVIGSDGTIYVASGNLYAIYADGSLKWIFTAEGNICRDSPAIGTDGTIYVVSGNDLLAVNPDGSLKWKLYLAVGMCGESPAIGSDGTIYIGAPNNMLYAIYGESGGLADTPWPMFQRDLSRTGRAVPCFIEVEIDIKPGSFPNSINLGSQGNVPVAIFSATDFDATTVDPITITLAGATVKLKGKGTPMSSFKDVDGDGLLDIVIHVDTTALQLSLGDTEAILEAETFDGLRIRGTDTVRIVNE